MYCKPVEFLLAFASTVFVQVLTYYKYVVVGNAVITSKLRKLLFQIYLYYITAVLLEN